MNIHEETILKINQLPEPLVEEVRDFIDFLLIKQQRHQWELGHHFNESLEITESDFSDYLSNLEDYEECLLRGEIRW